MVRGVFFCGNFSGNSEWGKVGLTYTEPQATFKSFPYLQYPEITQLLYLRVKSLVRDKNFRICCQDVAVTAPDPGHRFIVQITEGRIRENSYNVKKVLLFSQM